MNLTRLGMLSLCALTLPITLHAQDAAQESQAPAATHQAEFADLDADHDGLLSLAEAEKSSRIKDQFGSLDANKDSYLSMAELEKLPAVTAR